MAKFLNKNEVRKGGIYILSRTDDPETNSFMVEIASSGQNEYIIWGPTKRPDFIIVNQFVMLMTNACLSDHSMIRPQLKCGRKDFVKYEP